MTDSIEIRGIHCFGYHGVHAEERTLGQRFVVDIVLLVDVQLAAGQDKLAHGVDYGQVVRRTREIVEGPPSQLIETVAERVASGLLADFMGASCVEVCVHKPNAPIAGAPVDDVAVRIVRQRGSVSKTEKGG